MSSPRFRLKLSKLDWISLVDEPAQQTAKIRLVKRKGAVTEHEITVQARVAKIDDGDSPLVHCWAFTCTDESGAPYHDLQGDAISADDFVKAAEEFMAKGGGVDEMHDGKATQGRIAFCFPMRPDIAKAFFGDEIGSTIKTSGLMVAIRPTAEQLAKIRSGEYTGVSIAGTGIRELVKSAPACPSCNTYGKATDEKCAKCGAAMKRAPDVAKSTWSTADVDSLPDSSFLYIEGGGKRDADGKTTPRNLRHFPYRDATGKVDLPHLRDAIGRIPQSSLPKDVRDKLQVRAERLLGKQHDAAKRFAKQAPLTSAVDGHQHSVDLDDPADEWRDQLPTSYQTSEGATQSHCHAWTYDSTGKITIAEDSGHTHTIDAVVPADVLATAARNETGERCPGCGEMADEGCRFCPKCGCSMDRNSGAAAAATDAGAGSGPAVVVVTARAPGSISPPSGTTPTVKSNSQENPLMDPKIAKMLAAALLLPEAQRAHVAKLATDDPPAVQAFLGLDAAGRESATAAALAADPVLYTTKSGGQIRKSHGELAKSQAEQLDRQAAQLETANAQIAVEKAAREQVDLEKRAAEIIPLIGKAADERVAILRGVNSIADEALRTRALEALKGANAAFATLTKMIGSSSGAGGLESKTPREAWEVGLAEFAKSKNIAEPLDAIVPFLKTDQGKALKGALDAQRPGAQPS